MSTGSWNYAENTVEGTASDDVGDDHNLPWVLDRLGPSEIDVQDAPGYVERDDLARFLSNNSELDMEIDGSKVLIGDGRNLYELDTDENLEDLFSAGRSRKADYIRVEAKCLGVVNSDAYDAIMSDNGLETVERFMNSETAFYDPDEGLSASPASLFYEDKNRDIVDRVEEPHPMSGST